VVGWAFFVIIVLAVIGLVTLVRRVL